MQAELISIAAAFRAPSWSATMEAVFGHWLSLVRLPNRIRSISIGSKSAAANACKDATLAMSERLQCKTRRSLMPVRVVIHSSLVSMNVARSSFFRTAGGTHFPQPVISAYGMKYLRPEFLLQSVMKRILYFRIVV